VADRQRQTFKAQFRGMNTREPPDSEPAGKWPLAVNVRADGDVKVRTRPGYDKGYDTGSGGPITDIGSYATLNTDNQPRILVHDEAGHVYLDPPLGTPGAFENKGTVGTGGVGASIIPFRPSASPQSWAYIANPTGYEKFSAPDDQNNVLAQKVGIAEGQQMPEAVPDGFYFHEFTGLAGNYIPSGHATALCDAVRLQDQVLDVIADPVQPPDANPRYYIHVTGLNTYPGDNCSGFSQGLPIAYQIGMFLLFGPPLAPVERTVVEDVMYPLQDEGGIVIEQIYYFEGQMTGTRHRCIIVPSQIGLLKHSIVAGEGQPAGAIQPPVINPVAGLRRGSMIQLNGGEVILVEEMVIGPTGQVAIYTATTGTHVIGETITGVLSLAVSNVVPSQIQGATIRSPQINFQATPGLSAVTFGGSGIGSSPPPITPNPFTLPLGDMGIPQENDLVHISLSVVADPGSTPQELIQLKISFDINDGSFTKDTYYYPVSTSILGAAADTGRPPASDQSQFTTSQLLANNKQTYQAIYDALIQHGYNAASVLNPKNAISINPNTGEVQIFGSDGRIITLNVPLAAGFAGVYTELIVPMQSLQRTGGNHSLTLADFKAIQVAIITTGTFTVGFGGIWVGGGGQPDVGANGSPYYYRITGRSSLTGAESNPSPASRYGVTPRVQPVWVQMPASYDPQIDTWNIYRYGGSITSWRWIGSAHIEDVWFRDNSFDAAAFAGSELEFDNFEPWPTVDVPWHPTDLQITVVGTIINFIGTDFPPSLNRWLAGTLITLWRRPVPITGGWQIEIIECAGAMTNPDIFVAEPIVANQHLPYLFGPDANGVIFACGDPFRPGMFQGAKPNAPDATPNNAYDLCPSSEPLLGGQVLDGLPVIASSKRWWMLQPSGNPVQPNPVEMPTGRGLAAPYAHTTDGMRFYFWAKDGIMAAVPNQPGQMLTLDIANLFPQGETGITHGYDIKYADYTIWAPEYKYVSQFRLSVMNYILRAHYRDCSGTPRTLVCDMTPDDQGQLVPRWSVDEYADPMVTSFQPIQPPATLVAPMSTATRYEELYYADHNGGVWREVDLHNDSTHPIPVWLSTPEFDGGDSRVRKDWMDSMIDMLSPSGGTLSPVANGQILGEAQEIEEEDERTQQLIKVGEEGEEEPPHKKMDATALGVLFRWTDDFTKLNPTPDSCPKFELVTTLYEWTMEFVPQPVEVKSWESIWTNCGLDGYLFIYRMRVAATIRSHSRSMPMTRRHQKSFGFPGQMAST
jgi:hypothetical protein